VLDKLSVQKLYRKISEYDPSNLDLGESIKELKRISREVSYSGLVSGREYDLIRVSWIKSIIDHIEVPELVGYEDKKNNIEA